MDRKECIAHLYGEYRVSDPHIPTTRHLDIRGTHSAILVRRDSGSRSSLVVPFIRFECRVTQGTTVHVIAYEKGSGSPPHRAGTLQAGQSFDVPE